jgi:hypothetical protein
MHSTYTIIETGALFQGICIQSYAHPWLERMHALEAWTLVSKAPAHHSTAYG